MLLRDTCDRTICQRNIRDKRLQRQACFDQDDVKVEKDIVTFNEEEDEDISWRNDLKLNAARCFSGTHATVRFTQRNIRDKRLPREACFDQGDVKVEKNIVTFNEEQDEDILVEDRPQIERDTVFLRDTCHREVHQRNIRDKRLPREACFDQGDVKVEMKRRMKTFSWRKDLKLNASQCFSGVAQGHMPP